VPAPTSVLTRRAALVGALSLSAALAACTGGSEGAGPTGPSGSPSPSPDDLARIAAATRERVLATMAGTLADARASSAAVAEAARAAQVAHLAHADALVPLTSGGSTSSSPSGTSSGSGSSTPAAPVTAASLARAQVAAASAYQAALGPVSGGLARLLASVAAGDAALASSLRTVR